MILVSANLAKRNSRLLWLKFLEGRLLGLSVDDFVLLGLHKSQDIDSELFAKIEILSAKFFLREYSLRQIALSPKIRPILAPKLKLYSRRLIIKFAYPPAIFPELINETLDKIESEGYLNETSFVDYFLRRHAKKSRAEVTYLLRRLGVQTSLPQSEISDISKIKDLLTKKYSRIDFQDYSAKNKVISALIRKGFALNDIKTAIDVTTGKLVEY